MSELGTPDPVKLRERNEVKAKIRMVDAKRGEVQAKLDETNAQIASLRKQARALAQELDSLG